MSKMSSEKNQTKPAVEALTENDLRETEKVEQQQEITQFLDEAASLHTVIQTPTQSLPDNPYINQDIREILSRAYPLTTFQWTRNDTEGSCIKRFSFPEALFSQKVVWEKINHFEFFRAGLKIKVKVNASLYHYGKLIGVWRPMAMGKTCYVCMPEEDRTPGAYDNMYSLSSNPHVIISPNNTDSNEMIIPFSIPLDWIDLKAYTLSANNENYGRIMNNMGIFELWVLNPLVAKNVATDPPAYVTVYASFSDVEVAGYTTTNLVYINHDLQLYTSKVVPTGMFGYGQYSRDIPIAQSKTTGISFAPMHIANSGSDTDYTQFLNLNTGESDNSLIEYLSEPCLLTIKEIPASAAAGTNILSIPVKPGVMPFTSQYPYSIYKALFHTRLSFYAQMFSYWRGTIRYSFQITCSRFHSLRLKVYWSPSKLLDADRTNAEAFTISKVVDIEGETNFEMDIPWLQPWRTLKLTPGKEGDQDPSNGFLYVDVVNPIVYPESPMPPIRINAWISAQNDFQLILLNQQQMAIPYKVLPIDGRPNRNKIDIEESKEEEQELSGEDQLVERLRRISEKVDEDLRDHLSIGEVVAQAFEPMVEIGSNTPIQKAPLAKSAFDSITSLKQLTSKPGLMLTIELPDNEVRFYPFGMDMWYYGSTTSGYYTKINRIMPVLMTHAAFMADTRLKILSFDGTYLTITPNCSGSIEYYAEKDSNETANLEYAPMKQSAYFKSDMTVRDAIVPTYTNMHQIPFIVSQRWHKVKSPILFPRIDMVSFGATKNPVVLMSLENMALHHPVGPPLGIW
nr:structural polyprotein [Picornaviridae sp.]